jgi:hypothetical protein
VSPSYNVSINPVVQFILRRDLCHGLHSSKSWPSVMTSHPRWACRFQVEPKRQANPVVCGSRLSGRHRVSHKTFMPTSRHNECIRVVRRRMPTSAFNCSMASCGGQNSLLIIAWKSCRAYKWPWKVISSFHPHAGCNNVDIGRLVGRSRRITLTYVTDYHINSLPTIISAEVTDS